MIHRWTGTMVRYSQGVQINPRFEIYIYIYNTFKKNYFEPPAIQIFTPSP